MQKQQTAWVYEGKIYFIASNFIQDEKTYN